MDIVIGMYQVIMNGIKLDQIGDTWEYPMDTFMLQVKVAPIPIIFILMIAMETYILVLGIAVKQVSMILLG
jgi:hypothetical protein